MHDTPLLRDLIAVIIVHWLVFGSYTSAVLRQSCPSKPPVIYILSVKYMKNYNDCYIAKIKLTEKHIRNLKIYLF